MKYHVIILAGLLMAASCNCGVRKAPDTLPASAFGPASAEYLSGYSVYNDGADTLRYRYIEPLTLEKGKKYPLVLFLRHHRRRGSRRKRIDYGRNLLLARKPFFMVCNRIGHAYGRSSSRPEGMGRDAFKDLVQAQVFHCPFEHFLPQTGSLSSIVSSMRR